jgi:hypothetical protein
MGIGAGKPAEVGPLPEPALVMKKPIGPVVGPVAQAASSVTAAAAAPAVLGENNSIDTPGKAVVVSRRARCALPTLGLRAKVAVNACGCSRIRCPINR